MGMAPLLYPPSSLMLLFYRFSRSGGTGRRSRLKICRGSLPVWVRLPPPGPSLQTSSFLAYRIHIGTGVEHGQANEEHASKDEAAENIAAEIFHRPGEFPARNG